MLTRNYLFIEKETFQKCAKRYLEVLYVIVILSPAEMDNPRSGARFRDPDQKHVWTSVIGWAFSRVWLCCDDVIFLTKRQPKFVIGWLRLVYRWRIVKSNESCVHYWLKHDGMIVHIQADMISSY